ncbi:MAG TPA: DUF1684 domain-containing protein [Candidatus Polarisedimenticolaceae bacterium]|nr:DUF1684 domain-containing protein [Candidatus Polarisedimenticolaceae bacterium]
MRAAIVVVTIGIAACARSGGTMTAVPPPQSWEREIADLRSAKDASFAHDADSPLDAPRRASFRGLRYYPVDPSWRYAGWVEPYDVPERVSLVTTAGEVRPCERFGRVVFERDGRTLALQVYRLLDMPHREGGEGLFLPFKDATSGKETYAAGRYVDLEGPDGGPFTLDFNRAYNPSCAYGSPERYQCPVTPKENQLPIAVTAGERGP